MCSQFRTALHACKNVVRVRTLQTPARGSVANPDHARVIAYLPDCVERAHGKVEVFFWRKTTNVYDRQLAVTQMPSLPELACSTCRVEKLCVDAPADMRKVFESARGKLALQGRRRDERHM